MIPGVTVKRELDESSGRIATVVVEHKDDLNPQIEILDGKKVIATYAIPTGAQIVVNENDTISQGAMLAKTPRQASKTQDITGGLPVLPSLKHAVRKKRQKWQRLMALCPLMALCVAKRNYSSPILTVERKKYI